MGGHQKNNTTGELSGSIRRLKEEMNAVILAHYYEEPEIQDLGDFVGDSLGLCIEASKTDADIIVFCGVHFMAESAKLLNPDKLVLIPDSRAGCPMADMAGAADVREMKKEHPGAVVVTYVNSTAAVKAESDICCTSSNAVKIVESISPDKQIIFVPDQNLGRYVQQQTGRDLLLWNGYCPVHHQYVTPEDIREKQELYPRAEVLVHPECPPEITELADYVGSTAQILRYCREAAGGGAAGDKGPEQRTYIIGTEKGILYPLRQQNPGAEFVPAGEKMVCSDMKKITLNKVLTSLQKRQEKIEIPREVHDRAVGPIQKMLERSQ